MIGAVSVSPESGEPSPGEKTKTKTSAFYQMCSTCGKAIAAHSVRIGRGSVVDGENANEMAVPVALF